jgi:hypothetical protein
MVSILKKRQQGQNTRDITTRIISSVLLRYLCVKWLILLLTAILPRSTAKKWSRQGFATLLQWAIWDTSGLATRQTCLIISVRPHRSQLNCVLSFPSTPRYGSIYSARIHLALDGSPPSIPTLATMGIQLHPSVSFLNSFATIAPSTTGETRILLILKHVLDSNCALRHLHQGSSMKGLEVSRATGG